MIGDLVALLEAERLCLDCVASKLGRNQNDVAAALDELSATFRLAQRPGTCAGCRAVRITYKIA